MDLPVPLDSVRNTEALPNGSLGAPTQENLEPKMVYLIGTKLLEHVQLQAALTALRLEGIVLDESMQSKLDTSTSQIFVFDEFTGSFFELLRKRAQINSKIKIYGIPAILEAFESVKQLPASPSGYPLFCLFLRNCSFSMTGMRSKEKMLDIRRKILYMGGIFIEKSVKVSYLIAEKVGGERYRDACAIGISIMKPHWIDHLWAQRYNLKVDWQADLATWKCKPCYSLKVAFEGFDDTTKSQLITYVNSMDGSVVEVDDPLVTHIVRRLDRSLPSVSCCASSNDKEMVFLLPVEPVLELERKSKEHIITSCEDFQSPSKRPRFELHVVSDKKDNDSTIMMTPTSARPNFREKVKMVREEWFWTTLQVQYCAFEEPYLINPPPLILTDVKHQEDLANSSIGTPTVLISPNNFSILSDTDGGTPTSNFSGVGIDSGGRRKRKRNKDCLRNEVLSSLILPDLPPKIITEISQCDTTVNWGGSSLDPTEDVTDSVFGNILKQISDFLASVDLKSMSQRQAEFTHLIETERNYVTILVNIVKNFKEPCENENQPGGAILDPVEIKTIFHTILPIYSLHRRLLWNLVQLLSPWSEDNLIGKVYCDHANAFKRAYEPFVNFFEATKAEIIRCENEKPRFMAFLKIAQSRPECGKQSLTDLMIRPIQRLPSTALILSTLVKRTKEPNPDADWMLKAVEAINLVNKAINEGKRVTEARIAIFDIYNEIDGCPVDVVSAQRSVVLKIDVQSLSEIWGQKNDPITLVVFNDSTLIVKRRTISNKHLSAAASTATLRSPSTSRKSILSGQANSNLHSAKPYKFLEIVYHVSVARVVDILNAHCFGLIVRAPHEHRERTFGFTLPEDPNWPKSKLLNCLAKLAADSVDRLDYEIKLVTAEYGTLDFTGNSCSVLEKASKFASKTRHKVSRALSMTRTPNRLKRTVSQMMSPFSSKSSQDMDTVSQASFDCSTTPLRSNISTLSLWGFGSRRSDGTPKSRRTLSERETKATLSNIDSIQES